MLVYNPKAKDSIEHHRTSMITCERCRLAASRIPIQPKSGPSFASSKLQSTNKRLRLVSFNLWGLLSWICFASGYMTGWWFQQNQANWGSWSQGWRLQNVEAAKQCGLEDSIVLYSVVERHSGTLNTLHQTATEYDAGSTKNHPKPQSEDGNAASGRQLMAWTNTAMTCQVPFQSFS